VNKTPVVHIFDVDYTLVKKPSSYYFLKEGLREKLVRFSQLKRLPFEYARYKLGFANHDFIEDAVKHLAGLDEKRLDALAEHCFDRFMKPDMYTGALELIRGLKKIGCRIILATSSFKTIIRPLQIFLDAEESIASGLEFIDGKTSGRLTGKAVFGKNKLEAVRAWLNVQNIAPVNVWFYSDSYTDIPLLEYCGSPVAVNPDRILRKKARKQGWNIMRFRHTLGSKTAVYAAL
jgi:HAD superfamily hydrolase (TIGR01490 family)